MINSIVLFEKCDKILDSLRKNFSYTLLMIIITFGVIKKMAILLLLLKEKSYSCL
jgi:hypothetical protein